MTTLVEKPTLTVFVGPNGAGKSSLYRELIRRKPSLQTTPYVNADDLTRTFGGNNVTGGRMAIQQRKALLSANQSFIWETTGSGKNEIAFIQKAKSSGYHVDIRFIGLSSPKRALDRVKVRVLTGGHAVPKEDILRRFDRVMEKFGEYNNVADEFRAYDNSAEHHRLFSWKKIEPSFVNRTCRLGYTNS